MTTFSERLHEILRARCLTQKELAKMIGISQMTMSCYAKGKFQPGFDTLHDMAKVLNLSADYLLGLTDVPRAAVYHGMEEQDELRGL